jgi:hypothetical protein
MNDFRRIGSGSDVNRFRVLTGLNTPRVERVLLTFDAYNSCLCLLLY